MKFQSEHYMNALLIVLGVFVSSYVYLELTTVKKEEMLSNEGLYEVALEQLDPEEKEQLRQEMKLQQSSELRNVARDANDTRNRSYEDWSAQTPNGSNANAEQAARDFEAEVFAQTGGAQTRAQIIEQSNKRIAQIKQQSQQQHSNAPNTNAKPNQYAGAVMVDFSVNDRTAFEGNTWYVRNPGYTCGFNASGLVFINVEVSAAGRVTEVTYVASKSRNASPCMIEQAKKYAQKSRFSSGGGPTSGWISYQFEGQ